MSHRLPSSRSSSRAGSTENTAPVEAQGVGLLLDVLRDKWRPPILLALAQGTLRYGELGRLVPSASRTMLTRTLKDLERGGLVDRKVFAVVPSKVEYSLTPLGYVFAEQVRAMNCWAQTHEKELQHVVERLQPPATARDEDEEA